MKLMSESIFKKKTGGEKGERTRGRLRRNNQEGKITWVTEGQRGKPLAGQGMFVMPNVAESLHGLKGHCSG